MTGPSLIERLRTPEAALQQARALGLAALERGQRNLLHLAKLGFPDERIECLIGRLEAALPGCPDPDMALNNLVRFLAACAEPGEWIGCGGPSSHTRSQEDLESLVLLLSTSQYLGELLIRHPAEFGRLRDAPLGRKPAAELRAAWLEELEGCDERTQMNRLRQLRQRELLRIGEADIVREQPLEIITARLSDLADVCVDAALTLARPRLERRWGIPRGLDGQAARFTVLALGKLGGRELNYSSDIDLMFVYDADGQTDAARPLSNQEFFDRLASETVRILNAHTEQGWAYRVDLRLRPDGAQGPLTRSLASMSRYYDTVGRTWERQALIKARPIAGAPCLGREFLGRIEPFVYRSYLTTAEIHEIRALKRRIESKTKRAGEHLLDVKTGRGGIRDVEFVIQFLQLLNGGATPALRHPNTLSALDRLERAGCLSSQERQILDDTYRFLRKVEHRLQIMFDRQTHRLPETERELQKLALRLGYRDGERRQAAGAKTEREGAEHSSFPPPASHRPTARAGEQFMAEYRSKTDVNRRILNHLLHDAFSDDSGPAPEPEVDVILDPEPDPETIRSVLGRYPFRDPIRAYHNLVQLARETVPFLSTLRCRHFLASIAPRLLRALAATPDSDMALTNLEQVTASLGAKGVLWELFSFNPPTLKLFVDLCASSSYLTEVLIANPGMIDELMDSLILDRPRTLEDLHGELAKLCSGARDPAPIVHGFQKAELLRIGVRDILGKASIPQTTRELSQLAEAILVQAVRAAELQLRARFGEPRLGAGTPCRFALIALGKLGGRELGYHGDLDVVLIYEGDGQTEPCAACDPERAAGGTTNFHFFTELAQRLIRDVGHVGPHGRLYEMDFRLRPTGRSGGLVTSLGEFLRYHRSGDGQIWERLAFTRARSVAGDPEFARGVMEGIAEVAFGLPWKPEMTEAILEMRERLQNSRGEQNLKRGSGGLLDIEFLVQMLQLRHAAAVPEIRTPNTRDGLDLLEAAGLLAEPDALSLRSAYDFFRTVESRLRIVHHISCDDLPERPEHLDSLARRLGYESQELEQQTASAQFLAECALATAQTRDVFLRVFHRERAIPMV